jgi:patatin-related protein
VAGPARENEQELRLALALRGGTSLAVWIGGAVTEINNLRGALTPRETELGDVESPAATPEHPWAVLAKLAGYNAVAVDILAGASAGGLNATLLAGSIVYGLPFERMRRMWVAVADAESMARPVPKFWQQRPPSLLDGDGYFRGEVEAALTNNIPAPDRAAALGDRLDLLLTATLLDPVEQVRYDQRGEPVRDQRRRAWFRFRHRGRPGLPLSDFKAGSELDETVQRLALAARTTAAFPGGFEPARVLSTASPSAGRPPEMPDMAGLFSETAAPDSGPYRVIDGGILDNIPIEDAVRAIASASADRPTDRWLLYLNPSPEANRQPRPRALVLPVVTTAEQSRLEQESVLTDIAPLEEHNRAAQDIDLRRNALFAELRSSPFAQRRAELARQSAAVLPDHAVVRAKLDALAVHQLLGDAHIDDGRLLPPVVGDPLSGWSAQARTRLPGRLSAYFAAKASAEPDAVFADVRALLAGVQECLRWAQDAERFAAADRAAEIGSCKAALYRLRVLAEVLQAHADRYWIDGARLEPIVELDELDEWVDRVARRTRRLQHELPSPVRPLLGAVLNSVQESGTDALFQRGLAEFAGELLSIVESSGADAVVDDGLEDDGLVDAVAETSAVLHRIAARLAYVAPERVDTHESHQIAYALLEQAGDDERPDVLHQLVVLTAPLDVGRAPAGTVKFLRIVSDEQSPLPFTALRGSERGPLQAGNKIRGTDLGDFGAFLSAKWRANDWMWGRLDAAACLARLLLDPPRLVRHNAEQGADGVARALEAMVTRPTTAELGALDESASQRWHDFLADRWASHAAEVRTELEALFRDPDADRPLPLTTRLVLERLQWMIVARELPYVATVPQGADILGGEQAAVPDPARLSADVRRYSIGRQRVADLGEQRRAIIATRFALIGYRAVLPGGGALQWLAKVVLMLAKPLLMAIVFGFAAPTRAALVGFLVSAATSLTAPGGAARFLGHQPQPAPPNSPAEWLPVLDFSGAPVGPTALLTVLLAIAFAGWLGWQLSGRIRLPPGVGRWVPAVLVAAVLVGVGFGLFGTGFRLGPIGLAVVGIVLTWLATFAYRAPSRVAAAAITALAFAVVMALAEPVGGGWILAVILVGAYLHMVLLGSVDVLPPPPRPLLRASRETPAAAASWPSGDLADDQRVTATE